MQEKPCEEWSWLCSSFYSHGHPNRTVSYVGYINISGVRGGLSFTVK